MNNIQKTISNVFQYVAFKSFGSRVILIYSENCLRERSGRKHWDADKPPIERPIDGFIHITGWRASVPNGRGGRMIVDYTNTGDPANVSDPDKKVVYSGREKVKYGTQRSRVKVIGTIDIEGGTIGLSSDCTTPYMIGGTIVMTPLPPIGPNHNNKRRWLPRPSR
jgi:hypothetical protein